MKKLSILLLAILYIGTFNINAQNNVNSETVATQEVKKCAKTGEVCPKTCAKKKNGTCCQSKKTSSSCGKSKKGSFNFNKNSGNYSSKTTSCSKTKAKKCCKTKASEKADTQEETSTKE